MFEVVSPDLERLAAGAKVFPTALRVKTRYELEVVAREGAAAVRAAARAIPAKGTNPSGLRAAIAGNVRVSATLNTVDGAGVKVYVADGGGLAARNRYRVAELFEEGAPFRHKVFGRWAKGVKAQTAYPFLRKTMRGKLPELQVGVSRALTEAVKATIPNVV